MHTRFLKAVLMLVASVFCTFGHDTAIAQSVIHLSSPMGGEVYHVGDTLHTLYTAPTGGCVPARVQIVLRDERFSTERGDGEEVLIDMPNTGSYDWVIPASYGQMSDGVLGGSTYAIVIYYANGGLDSFDQSPPFTILPALASDTTMAASFAASAPGICGNAGDITYTFTGSCADSSNMALSWDFGAYDIATSVSYTRWTATVHYALLQATSIATQVQVTMTDTLTGARRWWQMPIFIDSGTVIISGTVPMATSAGFASYSDTIRACAGDSIRLNVAAEEWIAWPARYSWTSGDTVNTFISHSFGMNVATVTDGNGCIAKDSVYIMLDTACAGAHSSLNIHFLKSADTVCQYQYVFFSDSTKNESIHHIQYEYDFSRSAAWTRYWYEPVPPSDMRFDSAGTFWITFSAHDSVTGITAVDSQMIVVKPAPFITLSPAEPVLTSCSGTWLVATTDLPADIAWAPPSFGAGTAYSHSDSLLATVSAWYMVTATGSDGCTSLAVFDMLDSIHYTYDTTATPLRDLFAVDSLVPTTTPFATIDSFLTTDSKVYVHDTGSTTTVTIDSVFLDHLSHQVHNNCGTLMFSCDTATGYDTTFRVLTTTTHHPWNDTVSCMDAVSFTMNTDSFATVLDSSTSVLIVDTVLIPGGKMARMDTLSIHFHSSDSFRVTQYFSGQFNHCTEDTISRALDSNAHVTTVLSSWADTIPHDGPTIWCSSDTIYDVSDYTALDSSAAPTTVATTKSDTSHITGGIIVTIDTMIVFTHPVDSIHVHDSIMHITSHCTGTTLFDTSYMTVHITHGSYTDSALHPGISGDTIRFTTGIDQIALEEPRLYPNPASQNAWLDVPENFGAFEISLSAADGRKISTLTGTTEKNLLDLSGLADGTYLISVRKISDPDFNWARKIVKQ